MDNDIDTDTDDYDYDSDEPTNGNASKIAAVAGVSALIGGGAVMAAKKVRALWERRQLKAEVAEIVNDDESQPDTLS